MLRGVGPETSVTTTNPRHVISQKNKDDDYRGPKDIRWGDKVWVFVTEDGTEKWVLESVLINMWLHKAEEISRLVYLHYYYYGYMSRDVSVRGTCLWFFVLQVARYSAEDLADVNRMN
jgi:hypothetical protein